MTVILEAGSVAELQAAIHAKEGISAEHQLLVSGGCSISSRNSSDRALLEDGANVQLTVGLRGGGRNKHKGKRQQFTHGPLDEMEDPSKAKVSKQESVPTVLHNICSARRGQ